MPIGELSLSEDTLKNTSSEGACTSPDIKAQHGEAEVSALRAGPAQQTEDETKQRPNALHPVKGTQAMASSVPWRKDSSFHW